MYSRGTDRRRVKLPPGYDGSAFRHDTGEIRQPIRLSEPDMKIHSGEERSMAVSPAREEALPMSVPENVPEPAGEVPGTAVDAPKSVGGGASFLEGLLAGLGSEEWLLFLVILLLVADGSDAWDVILLLCLLLAVREEGGLLGKQ